MTPTQIDSAKFLIGKALGNPPEVKELSGPDGGPIPLSLAVEYTHPATSEG